jgi:hypothetical protein
VAGGSITFNLSFRTALQDRLQIRLHKILA